MEKLYEAIGTILGALIIFLISSPIISHIKKSRLKSRFGKRLQADDEINKILSELRSTYGFNRASLIEYHNGISSLADFGFKHATMTNESTDDFTKPIILGFQSIPCSLIANMLMELEKAPRGYVVVHDDYPDEGIKITHRMYGMKESWYFRLGSSLVGGTLVLTSTSSRIDLTEDDILDIKAKCQKILLIKRGFIT